MITEDSTRLVMSMSEFVLSCVITALFSGLWERVIEQERSIYRTALYLFVFICLNISNFIELPRFVKYIPIIAVCVLYCWVRRCCEWERPVFLLFFIFNLHTLSFTIADSLFLEFVDRLNARIDMETEAAIGMIYLNTNLGMIVYIFTGSIILFILYRMFLMLKIDLNGLTLWEMFFLSSLNVFGIAFSYMILSLSIVSIDNGVFILYDNAPEMKWKIPVLAVLLLTGEYSSLYVFSRYKKYLGEREYLYMREQDLKTLKDRVEESKVLYGSLKSLRHDINNHLQTIRSLVESGEQTKAKEYFDKITDLTDGFDMKYNTGNPLCDVVLNDKDRVAGQNGILMDVRFTYPEGISDFDMGIILSNLLDNAIEACVYSDKDARVIDVCLKSEGPCVLLTVANPYEGEVIFDKSSGLPISNKKEGIHGIGLANVSMIAEEYLGRMTIDTDGGIFTVTVMMQMKDMVTSA